MTNPKKTRKMFNIALAIVLAVGVWLYVVNVENPTGTSTVRDIPVTLTGEADLAEKGLMVTQQSDDSISLKLSGRKKTLMKLNKKNITLVLNVSSITAEGEHTLSCKTDFPNNLSSESVSVSDWDDLRVTVTVEKLVTKEIPVRGEFIGTEAEHCLAGTVTTDPDTLELKGPADTLKKISYASASVGGKEISDNLVETVPVVFMGDDGTPADRKNVTASAETVEVTVPVRRVVSLPLTVDLIDGGGATKEDVKTTITPSTITVAAQEEGETLPASISLGEIDLSDVLGDTSYTIPIRLPSGVTAWGKGSHYATVSLSFGQLATRQLGVTNVTLKNIPQDCDASLVSQTLYVWVRGTPDLVEKITPSQIEVEVDLSGLSPGDELHRLPAKVTLKEKTEGVGVMGSHYSVALRLAEQTPSNP